jgi:hypothetical protein
MKKKTQEICYHCGQKVDKEIWLKHMKKKLKQNGLPSLAKLLTWTNK